MDVTPDRAHRSWRIAERVKRLSDRLIRIGPFGLGLDAVIDWAPGAGPAYSAGAGALLVYEAVAAGASTATTPAWPPTWSPTPPPPASRSSAGSSTRLSPAT